MTVPVSDTVPRRRSLRRVAVGIATLAFAALLAPPAFATPRAPAATVSVSGEVASPASYTPAEIAALPQTTYPVTCPGHSGPGTVTGANLSVGSPLLPRFRVQPRWLTSLAAVDRRVQGRTGAVRQAR